MLAFDIKGDLMKILKKEMKETLIVNDVICNKCGCSLKQRQIYNNENTFLGAIDLVVCGNYGSTHLEDLHEYQFSLCETCLDKLFKSFKIPVTKEEKPF